MLERELVNLITEKINEAMAAPSCCQELKEAGEKWLASVGTEGEDEATKNLIAELEDDVNLIDDTIMFFHSDGAKEIFGEEEAAEKMAAALKAKGEGYKYCNCPACQAGAVILSLKL